MIVTCVPPGSSVQTPTWLTPESSVRQGTTAPQGPTMRPSVRPVSEIVLPKTLLLEIFLTNVMFLRWSRCVFSSKKLRIGGIFSVVGYYCNRSMSQVPCPYGYYCPEGSATPIRCPQGHYCGKLDDCNMTDAGRWSRLHSTVSLDSCPAL